MKVSEKRILILIVSVVFLFSCSQNKSTDKRDSGDAGNFFSSIFSASHSEYLSPDEMMKYVINSDNGLLKSKKINEYTYSVKYKPVPYIISREANSNEISKEEFVNRSEKLDGMQYFDLRLEVSGIKGRLLLPS